MHLRHVQSSFSQVTYFLCTLLIYSLSHITNVPDLLNFQDPSLGVIFDLLTQIWTWSPPAFSAFLTDAIHSLVLAAIIMSSPYRQTHTMLLQSCCTLTHYSAPQLWNLIFAKNAYFLFVPCNRRMLKLINSFLQLSHHAFRGWKPLWHF